MTISIISRLFFILVLLLNSSAPSLRAMDPHTFKTPQPGDPLYYYPDIDKSVLITDEVDETYKARYCVTRYNIDELGNKALHGDEAALNRLHDLYNLGNKYAQDKLEDVNVALKSLAFFQANKPNPEE